MRSTRMLLCAVLQLALGVGCSDTKPPPREAGASKELGTRELGGAQEAGSCAIVGSWKGTVPAGPFAGQTNLWEIKTGGTTRGTIGSTTIDGTWKLAGTTLTVTDTSSTPPTVACPAAQEGSYGVTFTPDCKTMTLKVIADPCDGRKLPLDGFSPTRQ